MFTKMSTLIKNTKEENKTMIDNKMLELAQRFIKEEFVILCYSKGNEIPEQLVKEELHAE